MTRTSSISPGSLEYGICGKQWKEKLRDDVDVPDPFTKTHEFLDPAGTFGAVGMRTVRQLAIQFDGHTDFIRIPPYLLLRDIDEASFVACPDSSSPNYLHFQLQNCGANIPVTTGTTDIRNSHKLRTEGPRPEEPIEAYACRFAIVVSLLS